MTLEKDIYRVFEDIVGSENISDDPAILDSYSYHFSAVLITRNKWMPRPEAVVLPANPIEVQAVVKACNRWRVRFHAMSTGWGPWNSPIKEGLRVIQIDLRRMNKILDIDEKNMYTVVEPYVTSGQLQAELMKRGLCCNIIGAGATTTALPPPKFTGYGQLGTTHSCDNRNLLAVEWVLPTGEILNLGSLGQDAGWFSGDGPGPSLRGVLRGLMGTMGGNGVFTKGAGKVYHWPGPPVLPKKWFSTSYAPESLPRFFKVWSLYFPSWQKLADFGYKIGESEVGYLVFRCTEYFNFHFLAGSNEEYMEMVKDFTPPDKVPGYAVLIAADTESEFNYKEKVVRQIITETDAKNLPLIEDPEVQTKLMWAWVRDGNMLRPIFRPTGNFNSSFGSLDTIDLAINQGRVGARIKKEYIKRKEIMDDGADVGWGIPYEQGHMMHVETVVMGHVSSEGATGLRHYERAADETFLTPSKEFPVCGGTPLGTFGDIQHNRFGPRTSNYHIWLRKLKEAIDPNDASDGSFYITTSIPNPELKDKGKK